MTDTCEVLAIVTAPDSAAVAAVRDATISRYSVLCSHHQRIYSFYYTPVDTEADHKRFADDVVLAAAKHAAGRHTTPRVDSPGAQS